MSAPKLKSMCHAILLGPLNVEIINRTIETDLLPGDLYLSKQAHWHIAKDHPEDYDACMRAIRCAAERPGLIGQSPKHGDAFEIIVRFRATSSPQLFTLIAIGMERDERGVYRIKSSYSIAETAVENRRRNGHLKIPVR
ncbi:hypothetical protein NKW55_07730 [Gluconobacter kondonii]|uniref:hypothetical protein n=1 Tax=Gluconobacter kondonii TaxID=941463 RepID=UPI0020A01E96|nr:hypothetical protein [Gluconobacter kondonii]MCP1236497.1 hypothetical protein [Gluconobacter kondonii]